ncbi:MAG: hypothetical protein ABFS45_16185 [Pseudomonadota bacterium]
MSNLVIKDLDKDMILDRKAMTALMGGAGKSIIRQAFIKAKRFVRKWFSKPPKPDLDFKSNPAEKFQRQGGILQRPDPKPWRI